MMISMGVAGCGCSAAVRAPALHGGQHAEDGGRRGKGALLIRTGCTRLRRIRPLPRCCQRRTSRTPLCNRQRCLRRDGAPGPRFGYSASWSSVPQGGLGVEVWHRHVQWQQPQLSCIRARRCRDVSAARRFRVPSYGFVLDVSACTLVSPAPYFPCLPASSVTFQPGFRSLS